MKKLVLLIAVLNIFVISNLQSQWLQKGGYWELSEKIPELRDLKILPEENLIITVSKDNTIRHIEYDSGKILKSGKPAELTEDNDYAKISSDGKTTVVARYVKRERGEDCDFHIINNDNNEVIVQEWINYDEMFKIWGDRASITSFKLYFSFFDYCYEKNIILVSINFNTNFDNDGGRNTYFVSSGYTLMGEIKNQKIEIIQIIPDQKINEVLKLHDNSEYKYIYLFSYSSSGGGSGNQLDARKNHLGLLPHTCDNLILKLNYEFVETWIDGVYNKRGYLFNLQEVFNHSQNTAWIKANNQLYLYDLLSNTFTDSVSNKILNEKLYSTHKSKYFHLFKEVQNADNINFSTFIMPYLKNVSSEIVNVEEFLLEPQFVESKNQLFIFPKDGNIRHYKPDILSNFSQKGFSWSKDTVEVGEEIEFSALVNIENCKFEWNFNDEFVSETEELRTKYSFKTSGYKTIKLKITTPDSIIHEFKKDTIINVLEVLKADFDIEILNSELPVRVRFTDKSDGEITDWSWNFGDDNTSSERNPIHDYKYSGDFSPRLIVKNSITADSIFKYEKILINTKEITLENSMFSYKYKSDRKPFRKVMKTSYGFCQVFENYQKYSNSSESALYLDFRNYNFEIDFLNQYQILVQTSFEYLPHSPLEGQFELNTQSDGLYILCLFPTIAMDRLKYYDILSGKLRKEESLSWESNALSHSKFAVDGKDDFLYWFTYYDYQDSVSHLVKTDIDMNIIWSLQVCKNNAISYFGDNQLNNTFLLINTKNFGNKFISVSNSGILNYEKTFNLDTNITLTNIKSVHENLILLHGYYKDDRNKTTYAYFAKYHPLDNTLQDTILYSRKDIRKLERVNNSTYAAIGQSRGRQGYLLLDTNLHQIRDVRVDSLTGEIKDMLLHDNKVYLFTEKIVSLPTMALGAKESYQTTASVLGLPEYIIATVDDSPIFFTDKLTHSAYPNPTSEVLNLKVATNESANYTIKLYDIFGTEILNIHDGYIPANTEKIFSIPTTSLPVGSYYYVITGGRNAERGKVMVVR